MMRKSAILAACCALLASLVSVLLAAPKDTIPPEILKKFDKDILSGKRPTIVEMKQADIFGLRSKPKFNADFVKLRFDLEKLSKVQKDIFAKWLAGGHNSLLLVGRSRRRYARLLGTEGAWTSQDREGSASLDKVKHALQIDGEAKAGVDVAMATSRSDDFSRISGRHAYRYSCYGIRESTSQGIVVVARYEDDSAAMGMFVAGKTKVYFLPGGFDGPDADRLRLNFWHWALGLKVPGSADTNVAGAKATTAGNLAEQAKYDILSLRNGDTVSGVVASEKITLKASYGTVAFSLGQIAKVLVEGDGENVDTLILKNGDMISGAIQEDKFPVTLINGEVISIAKDKVQEIIIQADRGD